MCKEWSIRPALSWVHAISNAPLNSRLDLSRLEDWRTVSCSSSDWLFLHLSPLRPLILMISADACEKLWRKVRARFATLTNPRVYVNLKRFYCLLYWPPVNDRGQVLNASSLGFIPIGIHPWPPASAADSNNEKKLSHSIQNAVAVIITLPMFLFQCI